MSRCEVRRGRSRSRIFALHCSSTARRCRSLGRAVRAGVSKRRRQRLRMSLRERIGGRGWILEAMVKTIECRVVVAGDESCLRPSSAQLAAPEIMMVGGWESGWWIGFGVLVMARRAWTLECWCRRQGSHRLPVTESWGPLVVSRKQRRICPASCGDTRRRFVNEAADDDREVKLLILTVVSPFAIFT